MSANNLQHYEVPPVWSEQDGNPPQALVYRADPLAASGGTAAEKMPDWVLVRLDGTTLRAIGIADARGYPIETDWKTSIASTMTKFP